MNYNILQKAKQIALRKYQRLKHWFAEESKERDLCTLRKTGTRCSYCTCGNPRKWFGKKTYQEQKAEIEDRIPIMHTNGSSFYEDHAIRKMAIPKKNNT